MELSGIGNATTAPPPAQNQVKESDKDKVAKEAVQKEAIQKAVYFSPVVQIDPKSRLAVLVFRDTDTGKVKDKFSMNMGVEAATDKNASIVGNNVKKYEKTAEVAKSVEEKPDQDNKNINEKLGKPIST